MRVHAETERWTLYQGDVLEVLRALPDDSVQCVVTSPPYYGLRDYGLPPSEWPEVEYTPMAGLPPISIPAWTGCLGLEPTPEAFVGHLVEVFREVHRVLRGDGVAWVNLGDSFNGSGGAGGDYAEGGLREGQPRYGGRRLQTPKPKDLLGIPWRVALGLQADGWWIRSDIVWAKRAPMPESVTDRPTRAHEFIFLLAKSQRYYYDAEALAERSISEHPSGNGYRRAGQESVGRIGQDAQWTPKPTRNARDVWHLGPDPYPAAHFATFPREIPRRAILAGSSPQACPTCGAPWRRMVEREIAGPIWQQNGERTGQHLRGDLEQGRGKFPVRYDLEVRTTGWEPTCTCPDNDGSGTSVVLDPFAGSGTTLEIAVSLGRRAVGIELSGPYCDLVVQRMERVTPALPGLAI